MSRDASPPLARRPVRADESGARFEARYIALRDEGAGGWGGQQHARRKAGWSRSLEALDTRGLLPPAGTRVLELGSGSGTVSRLLAARGYAVDGIEISPAGVAWARALRSPDAAIEYRVGDARDLGRWERGAFELVVDGNCLHCIVGHARAQCLAEVHRVLAPGSTFLVSTMVGPPGELRPGLTFEDGLLCEDGRPVRTLRSRDALLAELAAAGFRVGHEERSHNPWWDHLVVMLERP